MYCYGIILPVGGGERLVDKGFHTAVSLTNAVTIHRVFWRKTQTWCEHRRRVFSWRILQRAMGIFGPSTTRSWRLYRISRFRLGRICDIGLSIAGKILSWVNGQHWHEWNMNSCRPNKKFVWRRRVTHSNRMRVNIASNRQISMLPVVLLTKAAA